MESNYYNNIVFAFCKEIVKLAADAAETMRNMATEDEDGSTAKLGDTSWFKMLFEFVYFYLHLTGRHVSSLVDPDRCREIMADMTDVCIELVVESVCEHWPADMKENIKSEAFQNYVQSMEEYSQYLEMMPQKGESTKGTLFWEFAKMVAKLNEREHRIDYILACHEMTMGQLTRLNIKGFSERFS